VSVDGTVFVGSEDASLYAINSGGALDWRFPTGGPIDSSPAIDQAGTVYVGSLDGKVYAVF
jgi:outer membrane protein assembly factor BamB